MLLASEVQALQGLKFVSAYNSIFLRDVELALEDWPNISGQPQLR